LKTGDTFDTYWSVLKDFKANSKTCKCFENYHQEPQDEHIQKITDQRISDKRTYISICPKKINSCQNTLKRWKNLGGFEFCNMSLESRFKR
jgi:hypothetical protein